jgi:hypothetical protein
VFSFWPILDTAMLNFVFYALGDLYAEQIFPRLARIGTATAIAAGLLLLGLMTILHFTLGCLALPLALVFALPGIAGLVMLSKGLGPLAELVALLGISSLEIYLGHPLFSIAARAVLGRAGIHEPAAVLAVCVLAGVGGSLALAFICQRYNFPWLFRWAHKTN